jgi:hypothetical protein
MELIVVAGVLILGAIWYTFTQREEQQEGSEGLVSHNFISKKNSEYIDSFTEYQYSDLPKYMGAVSIFNLIELLDTYNFNLQNINSIDACDVFYFLDEEEDYSFELNTQNNQDTLIIRAKENRYEIEDVQSGFTVLYNKLESKLVYFNKKDKSRKVSEIKRRRTIHDDNDDIFEYHNIFILDYIIDSYYLDYDDFDNDSNYFENLEKSESLQEKDELYRDDVSSNSTDDIQNSDEVTFEDNINEEVAEVAEESNEIEPNETEVYNSHLEEDVSNNDNISFADEVVNSDTSY